VSQCAKGGLSSISSNFMQKTYIFVALRGRNSKFGKLDEGLRFLEYRQVY
jgi:hypothetical protein